MPKCHVHIIQAQPLKKYRAPRLVGEEEGAESEKVERAAVTVVVRQG